MTEASVLELRARSAIRRYALVLWVLLGLFCFRVGAQLIQFAGPVPFLPPFEAWHSGALPYGALLTAQLAIIAVAGWWASQFQRGAVLPRRGRGGVLLVAGATYFSVMAVRLALGVTVLPSHAWFGTLLPAFFHIVLAGFLLVAGHFHWRHGSTRTDG
jgi:hypothetical protein